MLPRLIAKLMVWCDSMPHKGLISHLDIYIYVVWLQRPDALVQTINLYLVFDVLFDKCMCCLLKIFFDL